MPDVPSGPKHLTRDSAAPYIGKIVKIVHPEVALPALGWLLAQSTITHAHIGSETGRPFAAFWEHVFPLNSDASLLKGTRLMNPKPSATARLVAALESRPAAKPKKATRGRDPAKVLAEIAAGRKVLASARTKFNAAVKILKEAESVLQGLADELRQHVEDVCAEVEVGPRA